MKKFLVGLAKVLIWLGFFYNLGLIEALLSTDIGDSPYTIDVYGETFPKKDRTQEEITAHAMKMERLVNAKAEKIGIEEKDGDLYSFEEYFRDLRELTDSMGAFGRNTGDLLAIRLQEFCRKNNEGPEQVEAAREKYFPKRFKDVGESSEPSFTWKQVKERSLKLYLVTLPLAFLLFLLWLYEANSYKSVRFRNPMSFLICLALYPIIIFYNVAKWWIRMMSEALAEIEIRRGKDKFFQLLSQDEVGMVKQFARDKISFKEFKLTLRAKGYVPKHGIATVAFAMIIMAFIPLRSLAGNANVLHSRQIEEKHYFFSDHSPGAHSLHDPDAIACFEVSMVPKFDPEPLQYLFHTVVATLCRGHWRGIDHVPLMVEGISTRK